MLLTQTVVSRQGRRAVQDSAVPVQDAAGAYGEELRRLRHLRGYGDDGGELCRRRCVPERFAGFMVNATSSKPLIYW